MAEPEKIGTNENPPIMDEGDTENLDLDALHRETSEEAVRKKMQNIPVDSVSHDILVTDILLRQKEKKQVSPLVLKVVYEKMMEGIAQSDYPLNGALFLFLLEQAERNGKDVHILGPLKSLFREKSGPLFRDIVEVRDIGLKEKIVQFFNDIRSLTHDFFTSPSVVTKERVAILRNRAYSLEKEVQDSTREQFTKEVLAAESFVEARKTLYGALIPGCDFTVFDELLKSVALPIMPPKKNGPTVVHGEFDQRYQELRNDQYEILQLLWSFLGRIEIAQKNGVNMRTVTFDTPAQRFLILDALVAFLRDRKGYEQGSGVENADGGFGTRVPVVVAAFVVNYLQMRGEQLMPFRGGALRLHREFGKVMRGGAEVSSWLFSKVENLVLRGHLTSADRLCNPHFLSDLEKAKLRWGPNAPKTQEVLRFIRGSRFSRMFKEMLTIQSPLTVAFFAYYLYLSPNKSKGAIELVGMLVACTSLNALARFAAALARWKFGANARIAKILRFCAKNPVAAIVVITGIMMMGHDIFDTVVSKIDDFFPEGEKKRQIVENIQFVLGEPLFEYGGLILRDSGWSPALLGVNPETDCFNVIMEEMVGWEGAPFFSDLKRYPVNGEETWDRLVDQRTGSERNVVLRELFPLEKIGCPKYDWYARQRFLLRGQVKDARDLQAELQKSLKAGQAFTGAEDFLGMATMKLNDGKRNDLLLNDCLDASKESDAGFLRRWTRNIMGPNIKVTGVASHFENSSGDLGETWERYKHLVRSIAWRVSAIQRLRTRFDSQTGKVLANTYDPKEWIPGNTIPHDDPRVLEGLEAAMKYSLAQQEAMLYRAERGPANHYGRSLASLFTPKGFSQICSENGLLDSLNKWRAAPYVNAAEHRQVHRSALIAAAEAAALYVRTEADVNTILEAVRHWHEENPLMRERIPWATALKIRDGIVSMVCRESERRFAYSSVANANTVEARAVRTLLEKNGVDPKVLSPEHVFVLCDIDRSTPQAQQTEASGLPFFQEKFAEYLTKERQKADILLFHQVMPRWSRRGDTDDGRKSLGNTIIMAMTCIECDGNDPKDWCVRTYSASVVPPASPEEAHHRLTYSRLAENGAVESKPFLQWRREHEHAARAIRPALLRMQTRPIPE